MTVGNSTITPVARSLVVRWSGGGSVWARPAAVLVEREGTAESVVIPNLNSRVVQAIRLGTVALIAAWVLKDRRRRKSND